jgi:hypothetical protein
MARRQDMIASGLYYNEARHQTGLWTSSGIASCSLKPSFLQQNTCGDSPM